MARDNRTFNPVNPHLARELGNQERVPTPEELAAMEARARRQASNQMSMAFIAAMVQGRDDFIPSHVVRKAYELAEAILERADAQDKADTKSPIQT